MAVAPDTKFEVLKTSNFELRTVVRLMNSMDRYSQFPWQWHTHL